MRKVTDLQELKAIELSILKKLDGWCRQNGVEYFLAYGTLIGAIRHKGFIPWDDDIDVWMLRPDYDRFVAEFPEAQDRLGLFLNSVQTTERYNRVFSKVCDAKTKLVETCSNNEFAEGAFVDVFPVDALPKGRVAASVRLTSLQLRKARLLAISSKEPDHSSRRTAKSLAKSVARKLLGGSDPVKAVEAFERVARQDSIVYGGSVCVFATAGHMGRSIEVPANCFSSSVEVEFEGMHAKVPVGYDALLCTIYGDYMELPPVEQRVGHHEFDLWIEDAGDVSSAFGTVA